MVNSFELEQNTDSEQTRKNSQIGEENNTIFIINVGTP